jgi:hypothetical protein
MSAFSTIAIAIKDSPHAVKTFYDGLDHWSIILKEPTGN